MNSPNPVTVSLLQYATASFMKVFITGAGGFLGSHICAYFAARGWDVIGMGRFQSMSVFRLATFDKVKAIEADLPSYKVEDVLGRESPDLVVHCAASASVPYSMQDPYGDLRLSVDLCGYVLDAVRRICPKSHFVYLSSASVYGQPTTIPVPESHLCSPISPYGYHKWMSEILLREYQQLFGLKTVALRIFSAFGERLYKQVVYDLFAKISKADADEVVLYGTGHESRDFIHGADVAQAIECIFENEFCGEINVASGKETTIASLAYTIKGLLNSKVVVAFSGENRAGDPKSWCADITQLKSLGFSQKISFEEGLSRVNKWFGS